MQRLGELREQLAETPGLSPEQTLQYWGDWTTEISAEQAAFYRVQKEMRQLRRQFNAKWKCDLEEELELALMNGDKSNVQRISRRLAGTGMGAKKRRMDQLQYKNRAPPKLKQVRAHQPKKGD